MQLSKKKPQKAVLSVLVFIFVTAQLLLSSQPATAQQESSQPGSAPPQSQANLFDLLELRVKGNGQLDRQSIERTVYPFLGKRKSLETVEQARQALEKLYHDKGYQTIGVDIPEQSVENGVVYLQVSEGRVSRLRVTQSRYFSLNAIKEKVPELAEGNVPNMPLMQQQLAELAKQSPDRTVTPILRAGETPGSVEVDLKVQDELPLHGKLELNGRNTSSTERLRTIGTLHYDNLWQKFHSASFMYQTSPENNSQVEVFVGSYVMPIIDDSKRLAMFIVDSNSSSVANAGALSVIGAGKIYGMRFVDPITTSFKNLYQTFTAGVSYKDFQQNLSGTTVTALFRQTPISYLPFLLGYSGNLKMEDSQLAVTINANFSLRNVGNTEWQFNNSRYMAKSDYAYLNGGIDYKHDLPLGMQLNTRVNGQIADMPLIPNEQFSIGGMQSVRGYYETQVLADNGLQGSVELYSPYMHFDDMPDYSKLRGLVFMDGGKGWIIDGLSGSPNQYSLVSAGSGFRMQLWKTLFANFDVAVPFTNQTRVERGNPRLHFQVYTEF